jgi:hypothetical protein
VHSDGGRYTETGITTLTSTLSLALEDAKSSEDSVWK